MRVRGFRELRRYAAGLLWGLPLGCGKLAGIDQYAVGEPPVDNPCGELEVRVADGSCRRVGSMCPAAGFVEDGRGGCRPRLPAEPCERGRTARLGADCAPLSLCYGERPPPQPVLGEARWVNPSADRSGDGLSPERPLRTIEAALASSDGPLTILMAPGDYRENLTIERPVMLLGRCADRTRLIPPLIDRPAISVMADADGSQLLEFAIVGGAGGIVVAGAENLNLNALVIESADGPGVSFEDTGGRAGGRIGITLIDGARGHGIVAHGATLEVVNTTVRNTRPTAAGDLGRGITLRPSAFADPGLLALDASRALSACEPSILVLRRSIIESCRDAGLFVEGSIAEVLESVIRDTLPQRDGRGRGIVAQRWDLGEKPAEVTVAGSVIERSADIGVFLDNACAAISDSTVREVDGTPAPNGNDGELSCLGNGVRIRFNRVRSDTPSCSGWAAPLLVRRALIENTREAAIHVEGAEAVVEETMIRGVAPDGCSARFGDGISAYDYDYSRAALGLRAVRIENASRAAVAGFGAAVALEESVLACSPLELVLNEGDPQSSGRLVTLSSALCGCGQAWRECKAAAGALPRALRGCADDDCMRGCYASYLQAVQGIPAPLQGLSVWERDRPSLETAVSDDNGCVFQPGIRGMRYQAAFSSPGRIPGVGLGIYRRTPQPFGLLVSTLEIGGVQFAASLLGRSPDLRNGIFTAAYVCNRQEQDPDAGVLSPCFGHGVEGARVEISPPVGTRTYVAADGLPEATVDTITSNSIATFYDVPPGEYTVRIIKPDDADGIDCSELIPGTDWGTAWPAEEPNRFLMRVEPGTISGSYIFCTVRP